MGAIRPGRIVGVRKTMCKPKSAAGRRRDVMASPNWKLLEQQILEAYREIGRNWSGFQPQEKVTISAIARTLGRKGLVDAFRNEQTIAWALEQLAVEHRIFLPPKQIKAAPKRRARRA